MTDYIGHEAAESALLAAASSGKMHHAWLLAGPRGMGKAGFALRAAHVLMEGASPALCDGRFAIDPKSQTASLIRAGSHPDFRIVQRLPKAEGKDDAAELADTELKRNIAVDQVRALQPMLASRPTIGKKRVIVIDSVDDLERGGANALLKSLEEPPEATLFFLISHAPDRLLPTIRSRCRLQRFEPLDDAQMRGFVDSAFGDSSDEERAFLVRAGQGAPGRVAHFAELELVEIEAALKRIYQTGDTNRAVAAALARKLALKNAETGYQAFLQRAPSFIAEVARTNAPADVMPALNAWNEASSLAARAGPLTLDKQTVVLRIGSLVAGLSPKVNDGNSRHYR